MSPIYAYGYENSLRKPLLPSRGILGVASDTTTTKKQNQPPEIYRTADVKVNYVSAARGVVTNCP